MVASLVTVLGRLRYGPRVALPVFRKGLIQVPDRFRQIAHGPPVEDGLGGFR